MNAFLEQFGIDWKLFVSQLVNFTVILIALTFFVYKPVIKILKERNKKIKEGLEKAEEANIRLKEIDHMGKEKMKEAQGQAMAMIQETKQRARSMEEDLQKKMEENHVQAQKELEASYKKQQMQAQEMVYKNAVELVKKAMVKTIEMKPDAVDEALIKKAAESMKNE